MPLFWTIRFTAISAAMRHRMQDGLVAQWRSSAVMSLRDGRIRGEMLARCCDFAMVVAGLYACIM